MIKANALRVGNKFLSIFGNVETVLSIIDNTAKGQIKVDPNCPPEMPHYVSEEHRDMYSHLILCWENGNQYKPCEINGVELTEERLIEFGFSDKEYKPGFIGTDVANTDFVLTKPNVESKDVTLQYYSFHCSYGGWPRYMQFKFVHELQNFFYALHEVELSSIKPTI